MHREHLLSIFNTLPTGIGLYALDGRLLELNDSFCRIFGIHPVSPQAHALNINDDPVIPADLKHAVSAGISIQLQFPYDFTIIQRSGCYKSVRTDSCHLKCYGQPVFNSDGVCDGYVLFYEDVTQVLCREERLKENRLKAELAMKVADIMLWEFDVKRKVFFSDNDPLNNFDYLAPITMQGYLDTIHPADVSTSMGNMQRMCAGEDFSFSLNLRFLISGYADWQDCTISGSAYEYGADGRVTKYVGTRKNNRDLNQKKQLLNKILDSIPLSIQIKDVEDNFRYIFCNEASKKMFGVSEDKNTCDVVGPEEVERIQKSDMEVFKTGTPYLGIERILLKDGRTFDTIVRKSTIEDDGKRLLLNVRWDQSLQNDLKRRAQLLSITMNAMNALTWFYEPQKDRLTFDESFEISGQRLLTEIDTIEKLRACLHPDDLPKFCNALYAILDNDSGKFQIECRIDFDGNGNYQWWESHGFLETTVLNDVPYKYMYGMGINIDGHKKAELALLENEKELNKLIRQNELILNNTNSGLAYIDKNYMVQWENISLCLKDLSWGAYKKGELCYKSARNQSTPCDNCVMHGALQSRRAAQVKFVLDNNRIVEILATPVFLADGSIDGVVIRMDDITERERMIEELREAKQRAEQSDKLKSAFLANMSHEIRTPLNAIVGFSELMLHSEYESEKKEFAQIINNNNELLLKLINDILDLSKLEAGSVELKYEHFDLSDYFDNITSSMRQRVTSPNVRLISVNPYSACQVLLDRNRVAQILINYVTNAIKYTPKGFIEMGYEQRGQGIYFYVKDSGIGIPDQKKSRLFQRFEKLDEFAQGTGLGLSICKATAEAMGGNVGFESVYGEGSIFWSFLPCKVDR